MKIAILTNNANSFVKPMAEGLERMFSRVGVESMVFYDGLENLARLPDKFTRYVRANGNDSLSMARRAARYLLRDAPAMYKFVRQLRGFDAIVIVNSIPQAFFNTAFPDDTLRALFPSTPIVLYDLYYLPTRGPWGAWLKEGSPERGVPSAGNWGLERYDWYLCASVMSETPMPPGPQPYSVVGLDVDDGTLFPEQDGEFTALLDFENTGYMAERATQIQALEESGTRYVVLNGSYSIQKIRAVYRKASIFMLAMHESFGLPICEAQACGSYVFTPYVSWCPSHTMKEDAAVPGLGDLPSNFVVYDNDKDSLIREITRVKAAYDAEAVVRNFREVHPQYYRGNDAGLLDFVQKIRDGVIRGSSHRQRGGISKNRAVLTAVSQLSGQV